MLLQDAEHLGGGHGQAPGRAGLGIAALDLHSQLLTAGVDLAQVDLHSLGSDLTDDHVVLAPHIAGNDLIKEVACDPQRGGQDHTVHAQNGNIGGTAADIHHHMTLGILQINTGTQSGCQRLLDQEHTAGTGLDGGIDHIALLNFGNAAGNGNDHTGLGSQQTALCSGLEHGGEHPHRHFMVGNDAAGQGLHGNQVAGGTAHHIPGTGTHLEDLSLVAVHGNHGGFLYHDTLAVHIDQHIGSTQVHTQVIGHHQIHKYHLTMDYCDVPRQPRHSLLLPLLL